MSNVTGDTGVHSDWLWCLSAHRSLQFPKSWEGVLWEPLPWVPPHPHPGEGSILIPSHPSFLWANTWVLVIRGPWGCLWDRGKGLLHAPGMYELSCLISFRWIKFTWAKTFHSTEAWSLGDCCEYVRGAGSPFSLLSCLFLSWRTRGPPAHRQHQKALSH